MKTFLLLALLVVAASCGQSRAPQRKARPAERRELVLALTPTLDCLPMLMLKEHFATHDAGYGLTAADSLPRNVAFRLLRAHMDCDAALLRGDVDGMATDSVRLAALAARGRRLTVVATTDLYWLLVAGKASRIRRTEQLAGKMVAMTRGSATEWLTARVAPPPADAAGTARAVFNIQINDPDLRCAMLITAEMDAAWLPEPQATVARRHGHNVIADSRRLTAPLGRLAFDAKKAAQPAHRKQLQALLRAYRAAQDSLRQNGYQAYMPLFDKYYKRVDRRVVGMLPKPAGAR